MLEDDGEVDEVISEDEDMWIDGMNDMDSETDKAEQKELFGMDDANADDDDDLFAHPVHDAKTTEPFHIKSKGDQREPKDLTSHI